MRQRPQLTSSLSPEAFLDNYWLKTELLDFCREQGLGTTGSKAELAHRVEHYLRTGDQGAISRSRKISGSMPDNFDLDTVIGVGWRCTRQLRAFFTKVIGPGFRFNAVIRQFVHEQPGRTLADAIAAYHENKLAAQQPKIGAQFEYNRFTREFWLTHPDASRDDLLAAWYQYRNTPKSKR